jgi:hypothetical protein
MMTTEIVYAEQGHADIYAPPSTIPADCSADVTSALSSWVATVPDNSVASFPANACYRIDGTLEVDGRNGLDFEGNGASFEAMTTGGATRAHWRFVGGSQITVHNMMIAGSDAAGGTSTAFNSSLQWQHGVDLRGVSGATLSGLIVDNVYGDCVYVGLGYDRVTWSSNVSAHDNTCQRNGRQGMSVTAGRSVTFDHNTFQQVGLTGVDMEPNGGITGAQNIQVTNNSFGTVRQQFVNVLGTSGGGAVSDISIVGNSVSGRPLDTNFLPAAGERWSNVVFSDNTSDTVSNSNPVVKVNQIDGLSVTNNYQAASSLGHVLVGVTASCDITVSGNEFPGGGAQLGYTKSPYACPSASLTMNTFSGTLGSTSVCPSGIGGAYVCSWTLTTSATGSSTGPLVVGFRKATTCISMGPYRQCGDGSFTFTTPSLSAGTYPLTVEESGRLVSTNMTLTLAHP